MTQSDKELLLIDLCARLPYGVKILHEGWNYEYDDELSTIERVVGIDDKFIYTKVIDTHNGEEYRDDKWPIDTFDDKLFLRPMSSMTDDEKEDLLKTIFKKASNKFYVDKKGIIDGKPTDLMTEGLNSVLFGPKTVTLYMDWLLKHHFDFNNLIKRKLALPAPPDMYKID